MLAMQRAYKGLKERGSDLEYCEGNRIQDFFEQVGLKQAFDFDAQIEEYSKEEASAQHESEEHES
jgi:hypothetical protein